MGLMAKLRGELVDIIEWIDDSRSTLAWRFPRYNNEIKNGAQLIVREGQRAVFVYRGQIADSFLPGHYTLTTEALPVLSTIQGWQHGFNSPFRSEVYFINTRPVTDLRWGTPSPITIRDPDFGMVQVRANGLCVIKIEDVDVFLREVIGTDSDVESDEIAELLRRIIATAFSEMVLDTKLGAIDLQAKQVELAGKLKDYVQGKVDDEYGLTVTDITMTLSLPEEITSAMTRGVAAGVETSGYVRNVGDVGRLQQVRTADAVLAAAQNTGGSAGAGMGLGLGVGLGQQLAGAVAQSSQPAAASSPAAGGAAPPPLPGPPSFHVAVGGQQSGPFDDTGLRQLAASGSLTEATLVWTTGMAAWTPAVQVPALAPLFSQPPPLPEPAPSTPSPSTPSPSTPPPPSAAPSDRPSA